MTSLGMLNKWIIQGWVITGGNIKVWNSTFVYLNKNAVLKGEQNYRKWIFHFFVRSWCGWNNIKAKCLSIQKVSAIPVAKYFKLFVDSVEKFPLKGSRSLKISKSSTGIGKWRIGQVLENNVKKNKHPG